jgi:hypothetical protein
MEVARVVANRSRQIVREDAKRLPWAIAKPMQICAPQLSAFWHLQPPQDPADQPGMNPVPQPPAVKPSRPLAQNRRRGNRHQLQIPATLIAEGTNAPPIEVTVTEMSVGGVTIRSKSSLPIDGVYQLSSFDTLIPPATRIRIVTQQSGSHGEFKIGAQTL